MVVYIIYYINTELLILPITWKSKLKFTLSYLITSNHINSMNHAYCYKVKSNKWIWNKISKFHMATVNWQQTPITGSYHHDLCCHFSYWSAFALKSNFLSVYGRWHTLNLHNAKYKICLLFLTADLMNQRCLGQKQNLLIP